VSNPYRAPDSELISAGGLAREGDILLVRNGAQFPHRCVKCNADAAPGKTKGVAWMQPAGAALIFAALALVGLLKFGSNSKSRELSAYLMVLLPIAIAPLRKTAQINPALCDTHENARQRLRLFSLLGFAGTLVGLFLVVFEQSRLGLSIAVISFFSMLALIYFSSVLQVKSIRKDGSRFAGCGEAFLRSLSEHRSERS
jgi:hypothetical protein